MPVCRGTYTFNQDALEGSDKEVQAVFTANNLLQEDATVPKLVVAVDQKPKLTLDVSDAQCTLSLWGELRSSSAGILQQGQHCAMGSDHCYESAQSSCAPLAMVGTCSCL